jgi:hypothetical protein
MPSRSTLEHVADIVIRRTLAEVGRTEELASALAAAYPFAQDPTAYAIWLQVLRRHDIDVDVPPPPHRLKNLEASDLPIPSERPRISGDSSEA